MSSTLLSPKPMSSDYMHIKKQERELLHSLSLKVDELFFVLRKKYQLICREINLLKRQESETFQAACLASLDENELLNIIEQMPALIIDNHIDYMIKNKDNNIFTLIKQYNDYLEQRVLEQEKNNLANLIDIDEKIADSLQHMGAMIYHLHIQLHMHLNLLNILIRNESFSIEAHEEFMKKSKEGYIINPCIE